jgi:hypothetical protein
MPPNTICIYHHQGRVASCTSHGVLAGKVIRAKEQLATGRWQLKIVSSELRTNGNRHGI